MTISNFPLHFQAYSENLSCGSFISLVLMMLSTFYMVSHLAMTVYVCECEEKKKTMLVKGREVVFLYLLIKKELVFRKKKLFKSNKKTVQ